MTAALYQLHLAYHPVEDRLLFRVNTRERAEYSLWLTRRYVQTLWPLLMQILESDAQVLTHPDPGARKTILEFQHQQALSRADYGKQYEENATAHPLGSDPLLISKLAVRTPGGETPVLCLGTEDGRGVEVSLSRELVHSFAKLLADTLAKTDWNLEFDGLSEAEQRPRQVN